MPRWVAWAAARLPLVPRGNVCTEDLVHMFEQMDVATGVNLPALLDISATLPALIGHERPDKW
ncbi:hypothetical protein DK37_21630 [Halomonas sp. SUBG004]|nr:hypothetical protein DK37_21630 [Halomonas sp. SUBG004]